MDLEAMKVLAPQITKAAAYLGAGLCMGIGAIGAAVGEGFVAGKACEAISRRPDVYNDLFRTMIVGQAISESTGIYSLVIAIILIFVT
jgi:F-type H+-transporting ATPase subunit c